MSINLIYHDKESISGGISPFDKAIRGLVKNKDIKVVSPYIGLDYFQQIIRLSVSWQLITDIEEWIISHEKKKRNQVKCFIEEFSERIHHYKDIHAKVIIAGEKAILGSANFTEKGITKRIEMSALIFDYEKVQELNRWFDCLWLDSDCVNIDDLNEYYKSSMLLQDLSDSKPKKSLPSRTPLNKSKLEKSNEKNKGDNNETLINCLKKYPSKEWMNDYFDLAKWIFDWTGLTDDDERLVMSIYKDGKLCITVNQRYVLRSKPSGELGLILPLEYNSEDNFIKDKIIIDDDSYFFSKGKKKVREARWIKFDRKDRIEFSSEIIEYWKQAILNELKRGTRSGYRDRGSHKSVFYKVINDLSYRKMILKMAFPK